MSSAITEKIWVISNFASSSYSPIYIIRVNLDGSVLLFKNLHMSILDTEPDGLSLIVENSVIGEILW